MDRDMLNKDREECERILRKFLEEEKGDVNGTDSSGDSPLLTACWHGLDKIVALLLAHPDIDVNQKTSHGLSPFLFASIKGAPACIQLLHKDARVKVKEWTHPTSLLLPIRETLR